MDLKLGFADVLIRPKRSKLQSRSEVTLERSITFLNSKRTCVRHHSLVPNTVLLNHDAETWSGVPIMASNMDSTGTFEIAHELAAHKVFTTMHKHYSVEEVRKAAGQNPHMKLMLP